MLDYIQTISLHIVVDEITGVKKVLDTQSYETSKRHYRLVVKRFASIGEDGIDYVVKTFDTDAQCLEWLNSLEFQEFDNVPYSMTGATAENFTKEIFAISLEEPQLAEYASPYKECGEKYIPLTVSKEFYWEQGEIPTPFFIAF